MVGPDLWGCQAFIEAPVKGKRLWGQGVMFSVTFSV
jgi:hypothetical protein